MILYIFTCSYDYLQTSWIKLNFFFHNKAPHKFLLACTINNTSRILRKSHNNVPPTHSHNGIFFKYCYPLWMTTMVSHTRTLKQIRLHDTILAQFFIKRVSVHCQLSLLWWFVTTRWLSHSMNENGDERCFLLSRGCTKVFFGCLRCDFFFSLSCFGVLSSFLEFLIPISSYTNNMFSMKPFCSVVQ